jgi:hypothetical protein
VSEEPQGQPQQPPPPAQWAPPQGTGWSQPGYGQPGYGQPGWGQSPYGQGSPWASTYYYRPMEPDNSPGLAGFILSITSIGMLVIFFGLLSPITFCLSIAGLVVSRNGIKKVERGETRKNRDLARWGFWLGVAGIVLSLLAIGGWVALFVADPDAFDDDEFDSDDGDPVRLLVRLGAALARVALAFVG